MKIKKEDKPGELRFYCTKCFGATEAVQKEPAAPLRCKWHSSCEVVVMREMIRPRGLPYYVGPERARRA